MVQSLMAEDSANRNPFFLKEQRCELLFAGGGPYWHLCTPGHLTEILFRSEAQLKLGVNIIAICAAECNIEIITDSIMSNHIHVVISGNRDDCQHFFDLFKGRLKRYYAWNDVLIDWSQFNCSLLPINDLRSIRNEIVYVNRNGYVINDKYTPFTYPWGSGNLFFNYFAQQIHGIPFNRLTYRQIRHIFHCSNIILPENYMVKDEMILPSSYCHYEKWQMLFRDSHQYFNLISKNIEAYCEISKMLGDNIFLTDDELYAAISKLSVQQYQVNQPSLLPANAKLEMARKMNRDYHASNSQIRRILKLDQQTIDELFPLKAKNRCK